LCQDALYQFEYLVERRRLDKIMNTLGWLYYLLTTLDWYLWCVRWLRCL
jgi:hypothetical protein